MPLRCLPLVSVVPASCPCDTCPPHASYRPAAIQHGLRLQLAKEYEENDDTLLAKVPGKTVLKYIQAKDDAFFHFQIKASPCSFLCDDDCIYKVYVDKRAIRKLCEMGRHFHNNLEREESLGEQQKHLSAIFSV